MRYRAAGSVEQQPPQPSQPATSQPPTTYQAARYPPSDRREEELGTAQRRYAPAALEVNICALDLVSAVHMLVGVALCSICGPAQTGAALGSASQN